MQRRKCFYLLQGPYVLHRPGRQVPDRPAHPGGAGEDVESRELTPVPGRDQGDLGELGYPGVVVPDLNHPQLVGEGPRLLPHTQNHV